MDKEEKVTEFIDKIRARVGTVVVGQDQVVERLLIALFTSGHILLQGMPGLAKTLLVNALGKAIHLDFSRVQFTVDLLPADLDVLTWLSPNQRIQIPIPDELQRPDSVPGRLRIDVLENLKKHPRRSIGSIADQVIHHHQHLFAIAVGASISDVTPEDLFGLRLIAEYASDENVACLAAAAASALRVRAARGTKCQRRRPGAQIRSR